MMSMGPNTVFAVDVGAVRQRSLLELRMSLTDDFNSWTIIRRETLAIRSPDGASCSTGSTPSQLSISRQSRKFKVDLHSMLLCLFTCRCMLTTTLLQCVEQHKSRRSQSHPWMLLHSATRARSKPPSITLNALPSHTRSLRQYGTMQFGKYDELIEIGYKAGIAALDKWKEEGALPTGLDDDSQGTEKSKKRKGRSLRRNSI